MRRCRDAIWPVLVALTQLLQTVLGGLAYLAGRSRRPADPNETTSSRIGRNAVEGKRWALAAEWIVDRMLGKGHCRDSIGT